MDSLGGQKGEVAGQMGEVAGVVASERVRWSHLRVAVCSLGSKPTGQRRAGRTLRAVWTGPWDVVRL